MECENDYSILSENATSELEMVLSEYYTQREIEDEESIPEDEYSSEDSSDEETYDDEDDDLAFDLSEA